MAWDRPYTLWHSGHPATIFCQDKSLKMLKEEFNPDGLGSAIYSVVILRKYFVKKYILEMLKEEFNPDGLGSVI